MLRNDICVVDARTLTVSRFLHTGKGAHGIYFSRDAGKVYVSNRDEGTICVLGPTTLTQTGLWTIPGGGPPGMGSVSAEGKERWLSGRCSCVVYVYVYVYVYFYVFDTSSGAVTDRIPVDAGLKACLSGRSPGDSPWATRETGVDPGGGGR